MVRLVFGKNSIEGISVRRAYEIIRKRRLRGWYIERMGIPAEFRI